MAPPRSGSTARRAAPGREARTAGGRAANPAGACLALAFLFAAGGVGAAERGPPPTTRVVRVYVEAAAPGAAQESGPLHIVHADGREVVQALPTAPSDADAGDVPAGFRDAAVASDGETVGWTELYAGCCQSYAIPLVLTLYRAGKVIRRLREGRMVWAWMFRDGGKSVAVVWGFTHGPEVGDYRLYDVTTGRERAHVLGDAQLQALPAGAPSWARQLEERLHASR
jgi:hypothetical protein